MTLSLKHAFQSGKADGADATLVQPSNWNEEHDFTMATARILGRKTASTGAVEELTADDVWDLLNFQGTGDGNPTRTLFHMTTPPTGWTKQAINDKALRVVSGSVSSGGSKAFSTLFAAAKAVSGTALTQAQLPNVNLDGTGTTDVAGAHTHEVEGADGNGTAGSGAAKNIADNETKTTTSDGDHSHNVTVTVALGGSGATHNHTIDLDLAYVDVVVAERD